MKNIFKKTFCFILAAIMLLPLATACQNSDENGDGSSEEVTDTPKETFTINKENASSVSLTRSDMLSNQSMELSIFLSFKKEMEKRFGASITPKSDYLMPGEVVDPEKIEILIGDNHRDESAALNEKLKALNTNAYGISVIGKKIVVAGTSPYLIYEGLDYILSELYKTDADGNPQITFEDGFEYIKQTDYDFPAPRTVVNSGKKCAFYTLERVARVPSVDGFKTMQGGGSDGKYAYYAMIDGSTTPETAILHKYDIETWELVATSKPMPSAHTNDICYDSKNNRLVISYCSATDGYFGIVTVDAETMEYIGYQKAPTASRGVCYFPESNQYLFAVNYTYYLTNDKFETIKSLPDGFPTLTSQGFDCDGDLIYDPRWEPSAEYQTVSVNTMTGKFIGALPLYDIKGEPENIFRHGNIFYMGCNSTDAVFKLALAYDEWW